MDLPKIDIKVHSSNSLSLKDIEEMLTNNKIMENYAFNQLGGYPLLNDELTRGRIKNVVEDVYNQYVCLLGRDPRREEKERRELHEKSLIQSLTENNNKEIEKVLNRPNVDKETLLELLTRLKDNKLRNKREVKNWAWSIRYISKDISTQQACLKIASIYFKGE